MIWSRRSGDDPLLAGEWRASDDARLVFLEDGRFQLGSRDVPYWLQQAGTVLDINHRTWYQRVSGDPASIVGEWRDGPNGESWTLNADGSYVTRFDGDPMAYEGTYEVASGGLSTYEYRGHWQADAGIVQFQYFSGNVETGPYTVTDQVLTLQMGGQTVVYTRL
jgi:hypothetical protein